MKSNLILAAALLAVSVPSAAQQAKSVITASNGVKVDVVGDDFANRYEYTSPLIDLPEGSGSFAMVAAINKQGAKTSVMIIGSVYYRGDWRFYDQALFRGGENAPALFGSKEVVSCAGSRYGGCSHREGFQITPTQSQIAKYAENGVLTVQLRARGLHPTMVQVPTAYFDAIAEAAGIKAASELPKVSEPPKPSVPSATRPVAKPPRPAVKCATCRQ